MWFCTPLCLEASHCGNPWRGRGKPALGGRVRLAVLATLPGGSTPTRADKQLTTPLKYGQLADGVGSAHPRFYVMLSFCADSVNLQALPRGPSGGLGSSEWAVLLSTLPRVGRRRGRRWTSLVVQEQA